MARVKGKRRGLLSFCINSLSRVPWSLRVFITFTAVLLAALLLLLSHSAHPRYNSGNQGAHKRQNFPRKQLANGNELQFSKNQLDLQQDDLLKTAAEDKNRIFQERPALVSLEADEGPLHLNKTGFMANVRTADLQGGSVTKAAPSTTVANPLGHYFNRNISVAAVEKLQPADPHVQKPSGQNKAALGYYFNKENPQSVQQASKEVRQQPDESKLTRTIADGTTVRQGKGLSSLVQTSVFLHQDQNLTSSSADGSAADIQDAQKPAGRQWPAKNVTVSFKPLTISLNPDDM